MTDRLSVISSITVVTGFYIVQIWTARQESGTISRARSSAGAKRHKSTEVKEATLIYTDWGSGSIFLYLLPLKYGKLIQLFSDTKIGQEKPETLKVKHAEDWRLGDICFS